MLNSLVSVANFKFCDSRE